MVARSKDKLRANYNEKTTSKGDIGMNRSDYIALMDRIKNALEYMAENIEDDNFITTKDINKPVLAVTVNEFIVIDRDKFKDLEISKNNRFLV